MRDKTIKICRQLCWQEEQDNVCKEDRWQEEQGEWRSQEGKLIPYIQFSKFIYQSSNKIHYITEMYMNEYKNYSIQITIWPTTVSLETKQNIQNFRPFLSDDDREKNRVIRIAKVSHADFIERSNELIQQTFDALFEKFNP